MEGVDHVADELDAEYLEPFYQHVQDSIEPRPVFVYYHDEHRIGIWGLAELTMALRLDKPVIIVAKPGTYVPKAMLDLAHEVVRTNPFTDEGADDVKAAFDRAADDVGA